MMRRIISGFGANAYGQGVTIIIQVFSLPLFLAYWDASTYGSWLMLSALPAFLSMADVGMVSAAGNKMTMAVGRADIAEANRVFQSAQLFMMLVCGTLAVLMTPAALFGPLPDFISMDQRIALAALLLEVLVALLGGLPEAVFKATGRYALGMLLSQSVRLCEWGGYILGLILFHTFAGVAICGLLVRVAGTGLAVLLAQKGGHGLLWGTNLAQKSELMTMARPAVSFMAFPLANALSFQGVTLLVGGLAGTTIVALFTTYRTIARVAVQLTSMFSLALWPEFARLFGRGGPRAVEKLFRQSALLGAAQALGLSLLLYFVSPWLLQIWTHGKIAFEPSLMAWMLAYAAMSGLWYVPRVLLLSTNQHVGLAGWSLAAGGLSIVLAWIFGSLWRIDGVAASMLASEAFIAFVCIYLVHRLIFDAPDMKRCMAEK